MTGIRASVVDAEARIGVAGTQLSRARTFSDVEPGAAFWYANANGLVEIAVNGGRADARLGLTVGEEVEIL